MRACFLVALLSAVVISGCQSNRNLSTASASPNRIQQDDLLIPPPASTRSANTASYELPPSPLAPLSVIPPVPAVDDSDNGLPALPAR